MLMMTIDDCVMVIIMVMMLMMTIDDCDGDSHDDANVYQGEEYPSNKTE